VRASENVQLELMGSRPRAFQRAVDEQCTLPLRPPKGGTKRDLAVFASKIQLLPKEVCCKVSLACVKTSRGKVIAQLFFYLTVHRRIAGDFPIYLEVAQLSLTDEPARRAASGQTAKF